MKQYSRQGFRRPAIACLLRGQCLSALIVIMLGPSPLSLVSVAISTSLSDARQGMKCPPSLIGALFLGQTLCAHPDLFARLAVATTLLEQQRLADVTTLGIRRLTAFRAHGAGGLHSSGLALDINAATNPYLMHEANETQLDAELAPVYERIAQFILGRSSVIPSLSPPLVRTESRHNRASRLYDVLAEESRAMQRYFRYMLDGVALQQYVTTENGFRRVCLPTTFLSVASTVCEYTSTRRGPLPSSLQHTAINRIRQCIMADWVTLTGSAGPAVVALEEYSSGPSTGGNQLVYPQILSPSSDSPANGAADRPFDTKAGAYPERSPLRGFLDLRKELVLALIDAGLSWGAIDLGPASGDIMHFHLRAVSSSVNSNRAIWSRPRQPATHALPHPR